MIHFEILNKVIKHIINKSSPETPSDFRRFFFNLIPRFECLSENKSTAPNTPYRPA
ncbi:hypothetical protein HMPREF9370_2405 [Neisseria wadsworthii 9715]|uniref:Uncharacterized protein n=1 Tax=Neisseria wadsworthii 9715 TaxID=1030841 RepID=G4CTJ5_9NEIS|nr:hypothetical protein HMPREF9370_2405 [Neisseria wadsworthii 9715]